MKTIPHTPVACPGAQDPVAQHPARKYPFLATLPGTLRYLEPRFFSAARDLNLESFFSNQELEALFIVSWVTARRDLNLVSDSQRHPPANGKPLMFYSDWYTTPLLNAHADLIRSCSGDIRNGATVNSGDFDEGLRARALLTNGHRSIVRDCAWKTAGEAFRKSDFARAYCILKRAVGTRSTQQDVLLRSAGLMLCLLKIHSDFECSMQSAEQTPNKKWDAFATFARKYERSPIPLVQRYADEALTFMTIGKVEDSFEAFRIFRRMLRISPRNAYAGPHAMRYCLARRTHFKLAKKIYPTLQRMDDTEILRAEFRKWRRQRARSSGVEE